MTVSMVSNVYSLILVLCCSVAAVFSYGTRLVSKHNNSYMGVEGIVQVQVNNTWSYLNGTDWSFVGALVSCRELGTRCYATLLSFNMSHVVGFKGVASFDSQTTRCVFAAGGVGTPCSTHMISVVKCHGSERGMGECTLNDLENLFTDGDVVNMSRHGGVAYIHNAAQVSCTGKYIRVHYTSLLHQWCTGKLSPLHFITTSVVYLPSSSTL